MSLDTPTFNVGVTSSYVLQKIAQAKMYKTLYRVIQEEGSIFWEVTVSVIVGKKGHINICLILNGYPGRAV
jgi:hypothetical protein